MLGYTLRRIMSAVPTLIVIITVAFFMMRLAPGGPFSEERAIPPEIERNLLAAYNLDAPLWKQYLDYMAGLLVGDLGPSFKVRDFTVAEMIMTGLPTSMLLGGIAILLALMIGTTLGSIAALRQNTGVDYSVMGVAMLGITIPNFVVAPLLTLFIGLYAGLLPVGGWRSPIEAKYMVLPIITLMLPQVAYVSRLMRASMLEVMRSNYIRTAYAKGLPDRTVILRHALRPALMPVISYLGPAVAAVLTGSVVVETIFAVPGVGRYFVNGALSRDYTLVMGTVVVYSTLIVVLNLVVDILYGVLDPKIKMR